VFNKTTHTHLQRAENQNSDQTIFKTPQHPLPTTCANEGTSMKQTTKIMNQAKKKAEKRFWNQKQKLSAQNTALQ
jgi:hypothetical protein